MQTYQLAIACSFIFATVLLALGGWYMKRQTVVMAAGALAALGLVVVTIVNALDSPDPDTPLSPKSDKPMVYNVDCTFNHFDDMKLYVSQYIFNENGGPHFLPDHVVSPLGANVEFADMPSDACVLKTQKMWQNSDRTANFPSECRGYEFRKTSGLTCSMAYLFGTAIGVLPP